MGGGEEKASENALSVPRKKERSEKRKRTHVALGEGGAASVFHYCQLLQKGWKSCEVVRACFSLQRAKSGRGRRRKRSCVK